MHYVLPFIHEDEGFKFNIPRKDSTKKVTMQQYYSYYLQFRDLNKITINNFGRLFQDYVTNMYSKIEMQRLHYFRSETGQKNIRAELYQGLDDLLNSNNPNKSKLKFTGKKVILPSSFIGGPRNMHQLFQDSMGLIRKFGKPDLFITFTCNTSWPEICKLKFQLVILLLLINRYDYFDQN